MRGLLIVLLLAALAAPAWGETMYARASTPVRSAAGLTGTTVATLQQGQAVTVRGREGSYYRIAFPGGSGYVFHNRLSADRPEDIAGLLSRRPAARGLELSELEAGGALRGLSPMAENYAAAEDLPEWAVEAVRSMQERAVTPQELEEFQREGRLGEYGEAPAP